MWHKIIPAAVIIALWTGPAYSQGINLAPSEPYKSPEEIARDKAIEQDYNAAASKIPDRKPTSTDPWGNVRAAPSKSSASKQRSQ